MPREYHTRSGFDRGEGGGGGGVLREYHTRSGFDRGGGGGGGGCRGSTVPGVVLIEGGGDEGVPYQEWF